MNCPVCNVPLTMTERQGVEIDYCQKCRGVWLDRGELDKIIERSVNIQHQSTGSASYEHHSERDHQYPYAERDHQYSHLHKKKKKRESFLSELFDFD